MPALLREQRPPPAQPGRRPHRAACRRRARGIPVAPPVDMYSFPSLGTRPTSHTFAGDVTAAHGREHMGRVLAFSAFGG